MNVCRLCMSEGVGYPSLFGLKSQVRKLVTQLLDIVRVELPEVDAWPSLICPECIGGTANVVNFCEKIKQTQLTIAARYGSYPEPLAESTSTGVENVNVVLSNGSETVYEIEYLNEEEMTEVDMVENEVVVDIKPAVKRRAAPAPVKVRTSSRKAKAEIEPEDVELAAAEEEDESELPDTADDLPSKRILSGDREAVLRDFGSLMCKQCPENVAFKDFRSMKIHNSNVHNIAGIVCCERTYTTRIRLFDHVQFHVSPESIECAVCHKRFRSRANLKTHMEDQHACLTVKCASCDFTCKSEKLLRRHELRHIPKEDRSVVCDLCDFKCNFSSQLQAHLKAKHSDIKDPHICEICGKHFSTKGNLANHHKSFHDPDSKKPICGQCGKAVRRLSRHLTICQKKLDLKCPHCDNIHPNMHALRTHIQRIHKKDKSKLTCHHCNKVLSREAHLKEHLATHTGTALYNCIFCRKEFFSNSNMYKHLRVRHYEQWMEHKKLNQAVSTK